MKTCPESFRSFTNSSTFCDSFTWSGPTYSRWRARVASSWSAVNLFAVVYSLPSSDGMIKDCKMPLTLLVKKLGTSWTLTVWNKKLSMKEFTMYT